MGNFKKHLLLFFHSFKNKFWLIILGFTLGALLLPLKVAQAGLVDWIFKAVIGSLCYALFMILLTICQGLLSLSAWMMLVVSDPAFIKTRYIEIDFVREGWLLSFNLAGIFIIIALIAIGISVALKLIDAKKALLRFFWSVIWIPLTPVICGFVVDFSNIFVNTFLQTGAANGLVNGLNVWWQYTEIYKSAMAFDVSFIDGMARLILGFLMLLLGSLYAAWILFKIFALMFARYVALWLCIMLAPLAFALNALGELPELPYLAFFTKLKSFYKKWWEEFIKWSLFGVFMSLFMYLAGRTAVSLTQGSSNLFSTNEVGFTNPILSISFNPGAIFTTLLQVGIPLIILQFGLKLSLEWAPSGAQAVLAVVDKIKEIAIQAASMGAGAAAAGVAGSPAVAKGLAGAQTKLNAPTAGKPGTFSYWARDTAKKFGQKTLSQPLTNARMAAANEAQRRKQRNEGKMRAMAKLDPDILAQSKPIGSSGWFKNEQEQQKWGILAEMGQMHKLSPEERKRADPYLASLKDKKGNEQGYQGANDFVSTIFSSLGKNPKTPAMKKKIGELGQLLFGDLLTPSGIGKNLPEKDLQDIGMTADQLNQLKQLRKKIYDKAVKDACSIIANGLSVENIGKLPKEDFDIDTNLQALAQSGKSDQIAAGIKKSGEAWLQKFMSALNAETDDVAREKRERQVYGHLSVKDIEGMGDVVNNVEFMKKLFLYSNDRVRDQAAAEGGSAFIKGAITELNNNFRFYAETNKAALYWAAGNPAISGSVGPQGGPTFYSRNEASAYFKSHPSKNAP